MCKTCGCSNCQCWKTKEPIGKNAEVHTTLKGLDTPEHTEIFSRMLGRMVEIGVGQHGTLDEVGAKGGLVPKNPFASLAESKFAHANPEKFGGEKGLDEWDKSTDFSKIPNKVKKAKK